MPASLRSGTAPGVRGAVSYRDRSALPPAAEVPSHPYAVRSVITSHGQTLYESPREPTIVRLNGPVSVDLLVSRVQSEAPAAPSLEGTAWRLEDLGGAGVIDNLEATLELLAGGMVAGKES